MEFDNITTTAWKNATALFVPELVPMQPRHVIDDIATDMVATGELPLEVIHEILRRQKREAAARLNTKTVGDANIICPDEIMPTFTYI